MVPRSTARKVVPALRRFSWRLLVRGPRVLTSPRRMWHLSRAFTRHFRNLGLRGALGRTLRFLVGTRAVIVEIAPPPAIAEIIAPPPPPVPEEAPPSPFAVPASWAQCYTHFAHLALDALLAGPASLDFAKTDAPTVSIVMVLHDRAELTLACLTSLRASPYQDFEVILVDNGSTDATAQLLGRLDGVKVVRNRENRGYPAAVNQGAELARGKYLVLLNNDTQLLGDCLGMAERYLTAHAEVGAVGGRIILLNGSLQEAGSIIWRDGAAAGYGRGNQPEDPTCTYLRDVDFCSAVFLMTPREMFLGLGGMDERFTPGYYEDADYCLRLWQCGWRVAYHPQVTVLHYESASSKDTQGPQTLISRNKAYFAEKHAWWLANRYTADPERLPWARTVASAPARILFIDDRLPNPCLGSGFPRARRILDELTDLGYFVTFYPLQVPDEKLLATQDLSSGIEVLNGYGPERLGSLLRERRDYYDIILLSRPHNMRVLRGLLAEEPDLLGNTRVLYDAEAIYCLREAQQARLTGRPLTKDELHRRLQAEFALVDGCWGVIAVSRLEAEHFREYGCERVYLLGHAVELEPGPDSIAERSGLLFVGVSHVPDSPNADSIRWLVGNILPRIQRQAREPITLTLAGRCCEGVLPPGTRSGREGLRVLGAQDDLRPVYEKARVFVAPTRFAAGIPLKLCEAAAHGVPIVATSLLARQLGWHPETHLLTADTAEEFAAQCVRLYQDHDLWRHLRTNALRAVQADFDSTSFSDTVQTMLRDALEMTDIVPSGPPERQAPPHIWARHADAA